MVTSNFGPITLANSSSDLVEHSIVKVNSSGLLVTAGTTDTEAIGIAQRDYKAGETHCAVRLRNAPGKSLAIASGAYNPGSTLYIAANGRVASSGTVAWGTAVSKTTAAGELIEVLIY